MAENERFMSGSLWLRSLGEFKRLNVVAFCGMMCALAMVLNMVASINVGPYIRIGFSGLPNQVVAYLFGPAVGGIFGGALDVIKYLIKPDGAFFPGFTISAALGGIIYGAFLYKKEGHPAPSICVAAFGEDRCQHPAQHSLAQYAVRKGFPGDSAGQSDFQRGHAADRYGDHVLYAAGSGQNDQEIF